MNESNTTLETDWKARYLDQVRQQEEKAADNAETEKLLCRIIIRLTLATAGLDPALDPHLTALRNAVRKGVQVELKDQLAAISEALIRANDEPAAPVASESDLLLRLITRSGATGRDADKLKRMSERLASEGDRATDAQIDSFLRLLSPSENRAASPGFLQRLFASSGPVEQDHTPNQELLKLLQNLDWPAQLSVDIERLESQLSAQEDNAGWVQVLTSLVSLLSQSLGEIQVEILDTRGFLEELTQRLVDIDKHVNNGQSLRQQSKAEGEALDQAMKEEVGDMRKNMVTATTLQQLRHQIGLRLDAIEQHVNKFVVNEDQRHKASAKVEDHLRQRLLEVQSESRELRSKMIEAHRQATTDTVTGLPNRLAYKERLDQEYARWKRFGESLTLLVWDVDDFKRINDKYGHHAGDKALRIIGQSLQAGLRETDFVARFGGEEFVMLLTGTNAEDARNVAETLRTSVKESGIHSVGNRVEVTISCGLSAFDEGDTPSGVFSRADQALYEAKKAGKDRVEIL